MAVSRGCARLGLGLNSKVKHVNSSNNISCYPGGNLSVRRKWDRRERRATFASAAASDFKYYVLTMDYVPDILEKRGPYRADHLGAAQKKFDEGKLVFGGALADPVDTGMFVFKDVTPEEIEMYCKADAYVQNGLVSGWKIRPWVVVVGGEE